DLQRMAHSGEITAYIGTHNWFLQSKSVSLGSEPTFWLARSDLQTIGVFANGTLNWAQCTWQIAADKG
ncbi:MAG: hypothetical protein OWS74_04150, partial [Firmicutes bacterium]|nr:hypothetical protein [Bacillota bacterium]